MLLNVYNFNYHKCTSAKYVYNIPEIWNIWHDKQNILGVCITLSKSKQLLYLNYCDVYNPPPKK